MYKQGIGSVRFSSPFRAYQGARESEESARVGSAAEGENGHRDREKKIRLRNAQKGSARKGEIGKGRSATEERREEEREKKGTSERSIGLEGKRGLIHAKNSRLREQERRCFGEYQNARLRVLGMPQIALFGNVSLDREIDVLCIFCFTDDVGCAILVIVG